MTPHALRWLEAGRRYAVGAADGKRRTAGRTLLVAAIGLGMLASCARPSRDRETSSAEQQGTLATPAPAALPRDVNPVALRVEVVSVRPHDRAAFTQGLLWDAGQLFESTGLYGQSSLRRVDPRTGEVLQAVTLPADLFGEGLARVDGRLLQLTWREHVVREVDQRSLRLLRELAYEGEGWGLCYDGRQLVRSDGSSSLSLHRATDFTATGRVEVTRRGEPVARLNELECVGDAVYANIWQTDEIVRIDLGTGQVTASIDASGLLSHEEAAAADVLNGIAYDPTADTFLITGKFWPKLFEVRFVPLMDTP